MAVDLTETARLMEANLLQVFNERDPARRREVIARTYTADMRWTDDYGVPTGLDLRALPRPKVWAERVYQNLHYWNELPVGGHFAAWEQPAIFVNELRASFADFHP